MFIRLGIKAVVYIKDKHLSKGIKIKMRIGLLASRVVKSAKRGFYNDQQIGLAKALASFCEEVIVYKTVPVDQEKKIENIQDCNNIIVMYLPSNHLGIHGIVNVSLMNKNLDILIYFSDTQLSVPKVYKWTKKYNIRFYPYIGVIESHNNNALKRMVANQLLIRNINVYKKCYCFVKTPTVEISLKKYGIKNTKVVPVGLDLNLLKSDYAQYDVLKLKEKYGYSKDDKIILFIGRFVEEKQPVRMIEIFSKVIQFDKQYKLLMVGYGELRDIVFEKINNYGLNNKVRVIEKIPNSDIWELYCMADSFVNLNSQEIFGMAILEAMYYGCKVVAWNASGPDLIIEDGVSGWLVQSNADVVKRIMEDIPDYKYIAHEKIIKEFTWPIVVRNILEIICS